MQSLKSPSLARLARAIALATSVASLAGCAVVSAVDTTAGLAISAAGLAADAAIGTVRLTGKAIGAAADLAVPDESPEK